MDAQQAVRFIDRLLERSQQRKLNDLESTIVLQSWEGITYKSISDRLSYETDYIKQVAARLWRLLSQLLAENICKGNLRSVLERYQQSISIVDRQEPSEIEPEVATQTNLQISENWLIRDSCHSIVLLKLRENSQTTRSPKFDPPRDQLPVKIDGDRRQICTPIELTRQLKIQLESSILQNLSLSIDPQILMNNIFSGLQDIDTQGNTIDCLIINYYA